MPSFGTSIDGSPIECPDSYDGHDLKTTGNKSEFDDEVNNSKNHKKLSCKYDGAGGSFILDYYTIPLTNDPDFCTGEKDLKYRKYMSSKIYAIIFDSKVSTETDARLNWAINNILVPLENLNIAEKCSGATSDNDLVLDTDGDGIPDSEDNCPNISNASQIDTFGNDGLGNACGDIDNDGIGDQKDNCPEVHNPNQADFYGDDVKGDACGDADNDGIIDLQDNCIEVYNPNQADGDLTGTGDACEDSKLEKAIDFYYSPTIGLKNALVNAYKNSWGAEEKHVPSGHCGDGKTTGASKGTVKIIKGNGAMIERLGQKIPIKMGDSWKRCDVLHVPTGTQVIMSTPTGLYTVSNPEYNKTPEFVWRLDKTAPEDAHERSNAALFIGHMYKSFKDNLTGEAFEIRTPTAIAGVRG